nr:NifB/NifX family molybdenum-iron cluster-binding protein [uncultured Blautia sp.]
MRVILPVDEEKDVICVTFGRAPYFAVHDTETGTTEIKDNPASQVQGGAGLKAAQFVLDCQAEALITPRCGTNSAEVLQAADVKIYKSEGMGVSQNIEAFKEGKLSVLTHFHGGYQGIR